MKKGGDNSFGVTSVVFGILSIVFASVNGIIFGIIGLIFASKQQKLSPNKWGKNGKTLAIVGIILSALIIFIAVKYPQLFTQALTQY
jgi:hypothetical protein